MKSAERRKAIVTLLMSQKEPISGGVLAERFNVSRQIIVQDIAMLKATGYEILSTHYGYVLQTSPLAERVFKVHHTKEETEDELSCIVDLGGTVVDVFVWHKVYGRIEAPLNIFSKLHVKQFIEGVRSGKSTELMSITGGYHYHTVRADSEDVLDHIAEVLDRRGYTVPELV
ncbi:MAG: transcription repressor NadR [Clostridia bacterium]|nr:transcription repressor NadR [Clostridia bacterium]